MALDSDGDGAFDYEEGIEDRDGDSILNYDDYDPTGYFYDETDGRILTGGSVLVTGPGSISLLQDGSNGFYQFITDGTAGTYTINVTLPPEYQWSGTCLEQGPLDPTGQIDPFVLGNGEDGATGLLTSNACTSFYLVFDLAEGDPTIFNNNFPLMRIPETPIPSLSEWGMISLMALIGFISIYYVRRTHNSITEP
jgi:hypothetical protein